MTDTQDRTKARQGNLPQWNIYPFDCPRCHRHFEPNMIRLKKVYGEYHCHACHDVLMKRTAGTPGQVISNRADLEGATCATCRAPFGSRRIVVNTNGHLVHSRCPSKKRPGR